MKYIVVPHADNRQPAQFYLAIEEYVARQFPEGDYFFDWRVPPTVVVGRNQLIHNEINIAYCKEHGVHLCRRKSGGGAVYADTENIMFSYISGNTQAADAFTAYMTRMADLLKGLGIEASVSGRNDIIIDGHKVSGCAFYNVNNRAILHNCLLYASQLEHLAGALTPSKEKLQSKGVKSVVSRVSNVSDYTDLSIDAFISYVRQQMCGAEEVVLTEDDLKGVAKIQAEISSDDWIYGKNPAYAVYRRERFAHVGTMEASLRLKNDTIEAMQIAGDYFAPGDVESEIIQPLKGVAFNREAVEKALAGKNLSLVIRGLTLPQFLQLLFG